MPFQTVQAPWNFYRLGPTREKELFKRHKDTYTGVVIPAHIASYYSKFCTEFVGSLRKPYFIDPITYLFARDPEILRRFLKDKHSGRTIRDAIGRKKKGSLKRSYKKIVEKEYRGIILKAATDGRPLQPRDFNDKTAVVELVNRVIDFQKHVIAQLPDKYMKYAKYVQGAGKDFISGSNPPMLVIPPYFFFNSLDKDGWYPINLDLINRTKLICQDLPVFPVIFTSLQTLASSFKEIISDYSLIEPDGFLLWVDMFSGDQDTLALKVVRDFMKNLSTKQKPIISLYGDAFSLVLYHFGLTGNVCGICYGERKSVDQDVDIEGQIPPRYYLDFLKKKIQIETVVRRIEVPSECNCVICQRKPDPGTLNDIEAKEHFMLIREQELQELREGISAEQMANQLDQSFQQYQNDPLLSPITHLKNWAEVLRG